MNQPVAVSSVEQKSLVIYNKYDVLYDGLCSEVLNLSPFRSSNGHRIAPTFFILPFLFKTLIHPARAFCVGYYEGVCVSFHGLVNCFSALCPFPFDLWSHVYHSLTLYIHKGLPLASPPSPLLHMSELVSEPQSICHFALAVYLNL